MSSRRDGAENPLPEEVTFKARTESMGVTIQDVLFDVPQLSLFIEEHLVRLKTTRLSEEQLIAIKETLEYQFLPEGTRLLIVASWIKGYQGKLVSSGAQVY